MTASSAWRRAWRRAPGAVLIRGDRQAELGIGIELLSRLRTAGVPSVAFEVQGE